MPVFNFCILVISYLVIVLCEYIVSKFFVATLNLTLQTGVWLMIVNFHQAQARNYLLSLVSRIHSFNNKMFSRCFCIRRVQYYKAALATDCMLLPGELHKLPALGCIPDTLPALG